MKTRGSIAGVLILALSGLLLCLADEPGSGETGLGRTGSQIIANEIQKPDHSLILTLLFPDTEDWMPVERMPRLGRADLESVEPKLRTAYWGSQVSQRQESDECSLINRLFDPNWKSEDFFYRCDVDADGEDDIIYAGPGFCAEGDVTIIWFGGKSGFVIRQGHLWQIRALRILPGNPPRVGSVAVGCCDSQYDEYFSGTLANPRNAADESLPSRLRPKVILKDTTIPEILVGPTRFSVRAKELVLRSSPKADDRYEEGRGRYWGNAVFGNILSKYLPGCGGTVIGSNKKGESELWYFVLLDDCERFRTHSPFEVSAGWVQATEVSLVK